MDKKIVLVFATLFFQKMVIGASFQERQRVRELRMHQQGEQYQIQNQQIIELIPEIMEQARLRHYPLPENFGLGYMALVGMRAVQHNRQREQREPIGQREQPLQRERRPADFPQTTDFVRNLALWRDRERGNNERFERSRERVLPEETVLKKIGKLTAVNRGEIPKNWQCPICWDDDETQLIRATRCQPVNHLYHERPCLEELLKRGANTCPLCRQNMFGV